MLGDAPGGPPAGAEGTHRATPTKYPTLLNIHGGPFTQYGNRLLRRVPGVRPAPATPSCTATRAARRATPRRGAAPSAGPRRSTPGTGLGHASTTRT